MFGIKSIDALSQEHRDKIEDVSDERGNGDGIFIYLKKEFADQDFDPFWNCRQIHEWTVKKAINRLRGSVRVTPQNTDENDKPIWAAPGPEKIFLKGLSFQQADAFVWAAQATNDLIYDDANDDAAKPTDEGPWASVDMKDLWFVRDEYVLEDLVYRLEVMLPEMAEDAEDKKQARKDCRSAEAMSKKLRKHMKNPNYNPFTAIGEV